MSDPQQPPPNQPGGNPPPPPPGGQPPPPPGGQPPPPPPPPPGGQPPPPPGGQPPGGGYPPPPPPPPGGGGGYGPPPGGGYPPPPPPPPPGGGYGQPPSGPGLSVGTAISYGWDKFKGNWGTWVGVTLVFWLILVALQGISVAANWDNAEVGDTSFSYSTGITFVGVVVLIVSVIVSYLMQAAQTRGALQETTGSKPSFGDFFNWGDRAGTVILTLLMLGVLSAIGYALCYLPGIIFTFFAWYTLWFVIDRGMGPWDALQASFRLVGSNFGVVLLLALALIGINIVGVCLCGIGLLVTIPLTVIATGYSFKALTGQPVA
ncbi:putative membrane protein [Mumia flava]|uniref:Putative membrane protein n=1 Tax=Mumia flava TaxID=1348852 RepID=A0A0B2B834_9ACTN|nr:hypothetical protein [Mumia flava]PJJ56724.1 putative membrane protein [Mumia flava]